MGQKEMSIHTWFKNKIHQIYGKNIIHIKAPAGIYSSRRGISDFIMCIYGVFVAVEIKTVDGTITAIQQNFLDEVMTAGGLSLCMYGKDPEVYNIIHRFICSKLNTEIIL